MGGKVARQDALIGDLASRQHGVVSIRQLRRLGVSERAAQARVASGRLYRVHRGVYTVGHSGLAAEGRWLAAVLALGRGPGVAGAAVLNYWQAAVSHRSAACLWGLLREAEGPVDVIVRGGGGRASRVGIRVHRSFSLLPRDVTLRRGIPVTTPARTISDLRRSTSAGSAGAVSRRELRRAMRQADVLGLPIEDGGSLGRTRSDLEEDFLEICRRHRLPVPEVNVRVGRHLVDFLWREQRLVVETDSYLYHRGKVAFQDDRDRDLEFKRLGYEVMRLSERQVNEEPDRVAATLISILGGCSEVDACR